MTRIPVCRETLILVVSVGFALCPMLLRAQSLTLAWNPSPSPNVTGYTILYSTNGTDFTYEVDAGTNTTLTVSNLPSGIVYFEVQSHDSSSNASLPSNEVEDSIPYPLEVSNLTFTELAPPNPSVMLTWSANPSTPANPVAGYVVYFGTVPGNLTNFVVTTNTSVTVSNLPQGAEIFFETVASNYGGSQGPPSGEDSTPSPLVVSNLQVSQLAQPPPGVVLTWSPNPSTATNLVAGYAVYYGTNRANLTNSVGTTNTSVIVSNLQTGVNYYFEVVASNFFGAQGPPSSRVGSSFPVPLLVSNLAVSGTIAAPESAALTWSASPSNSFNPLAGFKVYYGGDGENFPFVIDVGTNTSVTISNLPPGLLYFEVRAYNGSGQEGSPSSQVEYFVLNSLSAVLISTNALAATTNSIGTFVLLIGGNGVISPSSSASMYESGKRYTLTAVANSGWAFANWTSNGIVVAATQKYAFTLGESNLTLQANFIPFVPNPFTKDVKTYRGLFYPITNELAEESSGSFSAAVTKTGAFSATLHLAGQTFSYTGQFSSAGVTPIKTFNRPGGLSPITVQLGLDLTTNTSMTGTISNTNWTADLVADPTVYSRTNPAPQAGKYSLLLGSTNATNQLGGNGFSTVTVNNLGNVSLSGTLGDGTAFSSTSVVSTNIVDSLGRCPFYVSLYGGKGSILGWLSFATNGVSGQTNITGQMSWFKLSQPKTKIYPDGFTNSPEALGSLYNKSLQNLGFANGVLSFSLTNEGLYITNQVTLGKNNVATDSIGDKITFTSASGLFKGSIINPSGKPITVNGIVLQSQSIGAGYFLGTSNSGSVLISPAP